MSKKIFLLLLFTAANLFVFNQYIFNNTTQVPPGYTNAPGDIGGCEAAGCHAGAPVFNNSSDIDFGFLFGPPNPLVYTKGDNYIFQIRLANQGIVQNFGWQVTALDASGNPIGTLTTQNQQNVALSNQGGREYVGHFNPSMNNTTGAFIFSWNAPQNYLQGVATFYIAALTVDQLGEKIYYETFDFNPDSTIVVPSGPEAAFNVSSDNVCIGETVNFTDQTTASVNAYSWDFGSGANPATSNIANPSVAYSTSGQKTVTLTVTTNAGSSSTDTLINVSAGPNADAGQDQSICSGGQTQLQASGGVAYSWSPSTGLSSTTISDPIAFPPTTTEYIVTVEDAVGCIDTASVTVSVTNSPTVSINDVSICPGDTAVLDAGNPGFSYDWSTGSSDQTIEVNQAGSYSVTVSSGTACTASDTAVVSVLPQPQADAGQDATVCPGDSVQIGSSAQLNYTYSWSPAGSLDNPNKANPIATPSSGTQYIVEVSNPVTGCVAYDTVFIEVNPLPQLQIGGLSTNYCVSDNSTYAVTLSPQGGNLSGPGVTGTDFIPANAGLGTHTLTYAYTDTQTGCTNSETLSVTVQPAPNASIDNLSSEYCAYDNAFALQGSPAGGDFYINGQSGSNFDPSALIADSNLVQYVYSIGTCADTATAYATVIGNISPSIQLGTTDYCKGDNTPYSLQGTPAGGTFSGFGVQGNSFVPTLAGVGSGTIDYDYDTSTCVFSAAIQVEVSGIELGADTVICEGDSVLLDASVLTSNISWNTGATTSTIKVSPNVASTSTYIVSGTDANACTTSDTIEVSTVSRPNVTFDNVDSLYCSTDPAVGLSATPSGGTFSGPGVSGNTFDPAAAGPGGPYTLSYSYQSLGGCIVEVNQQVAVLQGFSNPAFVNLDTIYCINDGAVVLNGTPAGGNFSGTGVVDSAFLPFFAGVGTHTLTYGIQSSNGCGAVTTIQVEVKARPQVQFTGVPAQVCSNSGTINLEGTPEGGIFSGAGVVDTVFDPSLVGVGNTNIVSYTYVDSFGCSRKIDQQIDVLPQPNASINGHLREACVGADDIVLTGQPMGGVFVGDGLSGNRFTPDSSVLGRNELLYVVTANNGCRDTATSSVRVFPNPQVSFDNADETICAYPVLIGLSGSPAGGKFSGNGVGQVNIFSPADAEIGNNTITYTYTDSNNCSAAVSDTIEVLPLPEIEISGLQEQYCSSDDSVVLVVTPSGGDFSGAGVEENTFVPSEAGVGSSNIRYTVTGSNNCINVAYKEVSVEECTSIENKADQFEVSLWPNPTDGKVFVRHSSNGQDLQWTIFDLQGKILINQQIEETGRSDNFEIDLSEYKSGVYLLQIVQEGQFVSKRIVLY